MFFFYYIFSEFRSVKKLFNWNFHEARNVKCCMFTIQKVPVSLLLFCCVAFQSVIGSLSGMEEKRLAKIRNYRVFVCIVTLPTFVQFKQNSSFIASADDDDRVTIRNKWTKKENINAMMSHDLIPTLAEHEKRFREVLFIVFPTHCWGARGGDDSENAEDSFFRQRRHRAARDGTVNIS